MSCVGQGTGATSSKVDAQGNTIYMRDGGTVIVLSGVEVRNTAGGDTIADVLTVSGSTNKAVYIISGYRSTSTTQHGNGVAVDLYIPGNSTTQTARAVYNAGVFNRVSSYTGNAQYSPRNTAHADYRSTGNQGLFDNWIHIQE